MSGDDLDALLDDVLDEFGSAGAPPQAAVPLSKQTTKQQPEQDAEALDGFSKDLLAEMQHMLKEMAQKTAPASSTTFGIDSEDGKALSAQTAELQEELSRLVNAADNLKVAPDAVPVPATKVSLSDTLAQTVERLQNSSNKIESELADEKTGEHDPFADMMKELGGMEDGGAGLEGMMQTMMKQLMSKDVLFDPLKDLAAKYPPWLEANKDKVSTQDFEKYSSQLSYCRQIIAVFESTDSPDFLQVTELMHKMQECGSPPKDILDDLAPGLDFSEDGIPNVDSASPDCGVQ